MIRYGLEFLISPILFMWRGVIFHQMIFKHLMRWSCDSFFLNFVYIVDYINGFLYIEPTMHPWDKVYLILLNYGFNVFLNAICKNFIEHFCINIHKQDWSEVLFLGWGWVLVWYKYQNNCGFLGWTRQYSFCFYFMEKIE